MRNSVNEKSDSIKRDHFAEAFFVIIEAILEDPDRTGILSGRIGKQVLAVEFSGLSG